MERSAESIVPLDMAFKCISPGTLLGDILVTTWVFTWP